VNSAPSDQAARDRFTSEWDVNFAVLANAGSGKTTAISQRLAAMALSPSAGRALERTAVVTYTRKAAAQISERARQVLRSRMRDSPREGLDPLLRLEKAFFGTIHSFCLLLARRHGNTLGVHLNPVLVDEDDDAPWHEFLDGDPMSFASLPPGHVAAFLRHERLEIIFDLARSLDVATAARLLRKAPAPRPPTPGAGALRAILDAPAPRQTKPAEALRRNKDAAADWARRFAEEDGPLPLPKPEGTAARVRELYREFLAPVKAWLAETGGVLAAELSQRYRAWRAERGVQTYSDQLEAALAVLSDGPMLEAIREDGWRVILDEAQDTDPKQFQVLVEITRPPGSPRGSWPGPGPGPRPGHLCMVGDSQQSIYSGRADIRNFVAHAEALGSEGMQLEFSVTFRAPERVVRFLNGTLPDAFGPGRDFNVSPDPEGPRLLLQVPYAPLMASPSNPDGGVWKLAVEAPGGRHRVDEMLAHESRHVARLIAAGGPRAVGAASLGDICVLAPRKKWLHVIRAEFEKLGVKTALQIRQDRSGDNPAYAWTCGLLAVICDPENQFEWVGVLRELFAASDAMIAEQVAGSPLRWDEPESYPEPIAGALRSVGPFILRCDDEGAALGQFASDLVAACGLRDKARLADPDGGLAGELERILASACELGAAGAGPRLWLAELLRRSDEKRGSGRPAEDAVNILTCHSAKGLEWPVVIPMGLWREPGEWLARGLRLAREGDPDAPVILDNDALGDEARVRIEHERRRDLVRLLYVTLTRAKRALVLPWTAFDAEEGSFAGLWGVDAEQIELLPGEGTGPASGRARPPAPVPVLPAPTAPAPPMPARVLPHALASHADLARLALHESGADVDLPASDTADPLEYGTWWHHLLEFVPWGAVEEAAAAHARASLARAAALGFGGRAQAEWDLLRASEAWACIREPRWSRLAEAGVLGPLGENAWIDGVMDLVLLDAGAGEVRVVDWKTNARRAGEGDDALLARLAAEYEPQLSAYGGSVSEFFPGRRVSLWLYSSAAGRWTRVGNGEV
jgi:ATP-dependent exoDNAse (exonuclease V) beta subunit